MVLWSEAGCSGPHLVCVEGAQDDDRRVRARGSESLEGPEADNVDDHDARPLSAERRQDRRLVARNGEAKAGASERIGYQLNNIAISIGDQDVDLAFGLRIRALGRLFSGHRFAAPTSHRH